MNLVEELMIDLSLSGSIKINYERLNLLKQCIQNLVSNFSPNDWVDPLFWPSPDRDTETVSHFFTLGNSINFMYWGKEETGLKYCQGKKGGIEVRGAMYMWRSLKLCIDDGIYPILNATDLSKITIENMRSIFQDDDGHDVLPELEERLLNWQDLGRKLSEFWGGEITNLLNKCDYSLYYFVQFFRQFRAFDDPMCKMIMVNALMHEQRGIYKFEEPIFPGMDYQILKQLLRQGILEPEDRISRKIAGYEILTEEEAKELRRSGLVSLAKIMYETSIGGHIIDNLIWNNRKKCEDEHPVCKIRGRENECPFIGFCEKRTDLFIPLDKTRYY